MGDYHIPDQTVLCQNCKGTRNDFTKLPRSTPYCSTNCQIDIDTKKREAVSLMRKRNSLHIPFPKQEIKRVKTELETVQKVKNILQNNGNGSVYKSVYVKKIKKKPKISAKNTKILLRLLKEQERKKKVAELKDFKDNLKKGI